MIDGKKIDLVAAVNEKTLGIGYRGLLPWHLPEDLEHFKRHTLGKPVIMGHTTYRGLFVKPLPGRANIVLSYGATDIPGAILSSSIENAVGQVAEHSDSDTICIIGGRSIYRQFLPYADTLTLSVVPGEYDLDCWFPSNWANINKLFNLVDEIPKEGFSIRYYERKT